ncbi:McrB family protein [Pontibacter arcticus]|uniref:DUF3578 domain-containing protein n=1 Tax=Pontibacter arcticus TaxID=2080288 RepID=A0A364RCG0_9BACT|nr:DUF3578 domain-containing protein [Pontibacter arcticus]RAU81959.1 DUF3578 domain-containing protein [Pontibacter arcticus]
MVIPNNIQKDHILKAIEKIRAEGIPSNTHSSTYDVDFEGKRFPPKLLVSYANIFANNTALDRRTFEGGLNTDCFRLLERLGFKIVPKEKSFFERLISFLKQAQSNELKTKSFRGDYQNLKVEVSFGKGNVARIPWIAFLRNDQSVSNGIYPVYLYYKDLDILVLAYGVSETQVSIHSWNLDSSVRSIKNLFSEEFNFTPARYGSSFVHSYYFLDKNSDSFGLNTETINADLSEVIKKYNQLPLEFNTNNSTSSIKEGDLERRMELFNYKAFIEDTKAAGLNLQNDLLIRFVASLCTKPFVILTGLAGSGKTKLAQAFSYWISAEESQICIVSVGADWTNREPLLGYPNALDPTKYALPENGAVKLLIEANREENANKPYFLILDEMNLSHVERYFADFLSAMESHQPIPLHAEEDIKDVPSRLYLSPNVFIIGTVNIDETTYMFSPKVLDRANAIEFRVTENEMKTYFSNSIKLDLNSLKTRGAGMASDLVGKAKSEANKFPDAEALNEALLTFFGELKKVGAEFGYRTASEIKRFSEIIHSLEAGWSVNQIVDAAIMQKLLPKIHGSRRKIEPSLKALASLCLIKSGDINLFLKDSEATGIKDLSGEKYPLALEKILRMYKAVVQDGFTSFAEA